MAFTKYLVREAFKNSAKFESGRSGVLRPDGTPVIVDANRNNVALVEFRNDDNPEELHTVYMQGDDLSDAVIDAQARNVIASLNAQSVGLAAITTGQEKVPAPVKQEQIALQEKQVTYAKASQQAMVNFRDDPAEKQAYQDLLAAQEAANTASAEAALAVQ